MLYERVKIHKLIFYWFYFLGYSMFVMRKNRKIIEYQMKLEKKLSYKKILSILWLFYPFKS